MLVEINPFQLTHFNELIELLQELSDFYPIHSKIESIYKEFISQKNIFCLVAISEKKVIGFGSIFFYQRVRGGKQAIIEDLIVSKDFRGLGIGSKILRKLISEAKIQKCFKISLESNIDSEDFYFKEGFFKGGSSMKYII